MPHTLRLTPTEKTPTRLKTLADEDTQPTGTGPECHQHVRGWNEDTMWCLTVNLTSALWALVERPQRSQKDGTDSGQDCCVW